MPLAACHLLTQGNSDSIAHSHPVTSVDESLLSMTAGPLKSFSVSTWPFWAGFLNFKVHD